MEWGGGGGRYNGFGGSGAMERKASQASYDSGDDEVYFDGGTGVARRESIALQHQQPALPPPPPPLPPHPPAFTSGSLHHHHHHHHHHLHQHPSPSIAPAAPSSSSSLATSTPPPPPPRPPRDRSSSLSMSQPRRPLPLPNQDQNSSNPAFFAIAPGQNTSNGPSSPYHAPPYSPSFGPPPGTPSYDSPTFSASPGYNGSSPNTPQHTPYNPASYYPARHGSNNAGYTSPEYRPTPPQRQNTTGAAQFSPTSGGNYNPSTFQPYHRPQPLIMPGSNTAHYGGYGNQQQQQYGGGRGGPYSPAPGNYMSPSTSSAPYSPALHAPPPSQSAPAGQHYQPPPPPPPPHPPVGEYGGAGYGQQSGLGYSGSQKQYLGRPETHYHSGSESDLTDVEGRYDQVSPPTPPTHGVHRSDSRPLPIPPAGSSVHSDEDVTESYGALYADIERELWESNQRQGNVPRVHLEEEEMRDQNGAAPLFAGATHCQNGAGENGYLETRLSGLYDYYSNESDAEAAAGLAMMQHDEAVQHERDERQNDLDQQRDEGRQLPTPPAPEGGDSDVDFSMAGMDLGMLGGGFAAPEFSYGEDDNIPVMEGYTNPLPSPPANDLGRSTSGSSRDYQSQQQGQFQIPDEGAEHPFPISNARVDTWGTGGLSEPSQIRRMPSYDEGDEELGPSRSASPMKHTDSDEEFPELFYHPPPSSSSSAQPSPMNGRPLPSPPAGDYIPELRPAGTYPDAMHQRQNSIGKGQRQGMPMSPGSLAMPPQQAPEFARATSLNSHRSSPQTVPPVRSKTDGRIHPKSNRTSVVGGTPVQPVTQEGEASPSFDLPPIPLTKKFDPKKLSSRDFRLCKEPWALSAIAAWVKEMAEGEQDLKEAVVAYAVSALFTHYVPTMKMADAETLAAKVVGSMLRERALVKEEEWVKFGEGRMSGVIYHITGNGCYSPKLHELDAPGRCYAPHCARTLKRMALAQVDQAPPSVQDWASFWKIKKEDITEISKKEIERQNNLHEIVMTEEKYVEALNTLQVVYRDQIYNSTAPQLITPKRMEGFIRDVFGRVDAVKQVSEEHLLPQLKFRQREQGPWVMGFSDIFREWIRKAKSAYLEYASAYPKADMLIRREAQRNLLFRQFLDNCRQDPRTQRLDWVTFVKNPITRIQRYILLLETVLKHTIIETEEKANLALAIDEIKAVTHECDQRVKEKTDQVTMIELGQKLSMRPEWDVDLRLEERDRKLIWQGDLQRSSSRFSWLETHVILFDHYLVLTKVTMQRDAHGGAKHERYDVSRMPIPMDLLVLESTNDDPVVRNAASRLGLAGPTAAAKDNSRTRVNTMSTMPVPQHTNSSSSVTTTASSASNVTTTRLVTNLEGPAGLKDDKILYPFRIKHLSNSSRYLKAEDRTYILYAPTLKSREEWCEKIITAKESHANSLHAQNAEPFRLKVLADTAFGYDSSAGLGPKPIRIRGTPLDRAIAEAEKMFSGARPSVVSRAGVNCATSFVAQFGREMVAVGTDYGVFVTEANNPRGWTRAIKDVAKVSQLAVLEEFSLFLVLADKSLIAYHLDVVVPPPGAQAGGKQRSPQKLSGSKDVGFFATGRIKDRTLVFYKRRELNSSTFKVLEPVFQKATEKKHRFSRKGSTEFFREFDEFYIPTECYGINLFHSSLSIHTQKGFEVMTLDKKQPWSVPELNRPHVQLIATRLQGQKPLGMFRLSDTEFLLCYEDCAVYVDKHGDINRSVIMDFVGKAKAVVLNGPYVLVFDQDFVEIRNAQNGRLRQVIAGRDVRLLDAADGSPLGGVGRGQGTPVGAERERRVKVVMAHPEQEGLQLVVELVLNEGQKE